MFAEILWNVLLWEFLVDNKRNCNCSVSHRSSQHCMSWKLKSSQGWRKNRLTPATQALPCTLWVTDVNMLWTALHYGSKIQFQWKQPWEGTCVPKQVGSGADTSAVTPQAHLAGDPGHEVVPKIRSVVPFLHTINQVVKDLWDHWVQPMTEGHNIN